MTSEVSVSKLSITHSGLRVDWSDGRASEFTSLWLADNDPVNRDAHSGQRLIDVADLPDDPCIREASVRGHDLIIEWHGGGPATVIDITWLARQRDGAAAGAGRAVTMWPDGANLDARSDFAWLTLEELRGDAVRAARWFRRLGSEGLAFVRAVPARAGAILEAVASIGLVQETNYGRLFDVRSVAKAENLAYTDLGLGLHTDNPYREPVPGFQVLHCILPAADGGDSIFADGYAIAAHLRSADPDAFAMLARTPVPFLYRASDVELYAERPLIELGLRGEVIAINYNNRSIAPLPLAGSAMTAYYGAYRRLARLLREPRFHLQTRMDAGDLVVFDNRRILHARTSFKAERHLQGCYLTRDSVFSRIALMGHAISGDHA
ncbi:MAG: TauD/TfdA family dioxygenase [Steroidobacterales bacterium]